MMKRCGHIAGAAGAALALVSLAMAPPDVMIRVVSHLKGAGGAVEQRAAIMRATGTGTGDPIPWEELPMRLPLLLSGLEAGADRASLQIAAHRDLPPISVILEIAEPKPADLAGAIIERAFGMKGSLGSPSEGDVDDGAMEGAGVRSLQIFAGGALAFDRDGGGAPLAGRARLMRRTTPALWARPAGGGDIVSETFVAWSVIP